MSINLQQINTFCMMSAFLIAGGTAGLPIIEPCSPAHHEIIVGYPSEDQKGKLFEIAGEQQLPQISRRLEALRIEVRRLVPPGDLGHRFEVSDDGRAIAAFQHQITQAPDQGVWIWPNWQDSDKWVKVDSGRSATFASVHHAIVRSVAGQHRIVELQGLRQFELDSLDSIRIANNGRWARLSEDGKLYIGELGRDDLNSEARRIPVETRIVDAIWLKNGAVLVAQTIDNTLISLSMPDMQERDSIRGLLGRYSINQDITHGLTGDDLRQRMVIFVYDNGNLRHEPFNVWASPHAYSVSPSSKFVLCILGEVRFVATTAAGVDEPFIPALPPSGVPFGWLVYSHPEEGEPIVAPR